MCVWRVLSTGNPINSANAEECSHAHKHTLAEKKKKTNYVQKWNETYKKKGRKGKEKRILIPRISLSLPPWSWVIVTCIRDRLGSLFSLLLSLFDCVLVERRTRPHGNSLFCFFSELRSVSTKPVNVNKSLNRPNLVAVFSLFSLFFWATTSTTQWSKSKCATWIA